MPELRTLPNVLAHQGDIVTPPLEAVVRRARRTRVRRVVKGTALVLVVALLTPTAVDWVTDGDESSHVRLVDRTSTEPELAVQPFGSMATGPVLPRRTITILATGTPTTLAAPPPLACNAEQNGGATDLGVTATKIKIVMTETMEFPTRYITVEAATAVRALFDEVNRQGGICGRLIDFHLANEVWGPLPWWPNADVFAGIAGPEDPAVDESLETGTLDLVKTALVGADGRTAGHHRSRWAWPTGLTTGALTRIAVFDAYRSGDRSFGLAYDADTAVGQEAAAAFQQYVATLSGARAYIHPIRAGDDLDEQAAMYDVQCAVALCELHLAAMPAETALKWLGALPTRLALLMTLVPTQLSATFWEECYKLHEDRCRDLRAWGLPTARPFVGDPSLWCDQLELRKEEVHVLASACALVEALRMTSPHLTKERLRQALDEVTYRRGLVPTYVDGRRLPDHHVRPKPVRELRPRYSTFGGQTRFAELEATGGPEREDPTPDRS